MELTSDEFRKKLHSGELMGKSGGLKYILKTGKTVPEVAYQIVFQFMKLTAAQINQLLKSGKIVRDQKGNLTANPSVSQTITPSKAQVQAKTKDRALNRLKSDGHLFIENELIMAGIEFECEFEFAPDRKFRADFHLKGKFILIEYEGIMSKKSRHTGIKGYTNDCEKYNLALSLGYKPYRFTAVNICKVRELIREING